MKRYPFALSFAAAVAAGCVNGSSPRPLDPRRAGVVAPARGTATDSVAGQLVITQYGAASGGSAIISGRSIFTAQRTDLSYNPLGVETIRGPFVAPLRSRTRCSG